MHKKVGHTKTLRILQRDVIFLMFFCALTTAASSQTVTMRNEGVSVSVVDAELNVYGDIVSEQASARYNLDGDLSLTEDWVNNASSNLFPNLGAPSGSIVFIAGNNQEVTGTFATNFNGLKINKLGGTVDLLKPTAVYAVFDLTSGIVVSNSSNSILLKDNITVTGGSSSSFVSGPILKEGDDAFLFPVGKGNNYQPISMSSPGLATDVFTAEYYNTQQTAGSTLDAGLTSVSSCEHWLLDRTNGASIVDVTLGWNSSSCDIAVLADKRVAQWDGAQWVNYGNGGTTGTVSNGTVISSSGSPITTYGFFALGDNVFFQAFAFPNAPKGGMLFGGGSNIFIGENTFVYVKGDLAFGGPGNYVGNKGNIDLTGDWRNEATANVFTASAGSVRMVGQSDQAIKGTRSSTFNNLRLSGGGVKSIEKETEVKGELAITDRELATDGNELLISNTDPGALSRTSGFVSTASGGRLVRLTSGTGIYSFPVGISGTPIKFKPIIITPVVAPPPGKYAVILVANDPTLDGFDRTITEPGLDHLHGTFYYKVLASKACNIKVLFDEQDIGAVDGAAKWTTFPRWENLSATVQHNTSPTLSFAQFNFGPAILTPVSIINKALIISSTPSYAVPKRRLDGGYYVTIDGVLWFKFDEEYNIDPSNDFLSYKLFNDDMALTYGISKDGIDLNLSSGSPTPNVTYGDNRYDIDFSGLLVDDEFYNLELVNRKNEKRFIRFQHQE